MKECKYCQNKFNPSNKTQLYCSKECKTQSYYKDYICVICSSTFRSKHPNRKYCSSKCSASTRVKYTELTCDQCETKFKRKSAKVKKGKYNHFCSNDCKLTFIADNKGQNSYRWNSVEVECEVCSEKMIRQPSALRERTFCSHDCYGHWLSENRSGENSYSWLGFADKDRGANWGAIAERIRERDGFKCQECGIPQTDRKHSVHHKIPLRFFDEVDEANSDENLTTLCVVCHGKQESHRWLDVPTEYKNRAGLSEVYANTVRA